MTDLFEGTVTDLSSKGLGVVKHSDGQVFFVKGAWPGDKCLLQVESVKKRYGFASIKKIITPSEDRVKSVCSYQGFNPGECGGCPWMIASYQSQLKYKEKRVKDALSRSGIGFDEQAILPIAASKQVLGYRNRAQFKTDGKVIGFVSQETNTIAPVEDCLVLSEKNRNTLKQLVSKLPNHDWLPKGKYRWNLLEIDEQVDADKVELNRRREFQQGNSLQNEFMKNWLRDSLKRDAVKESILELFCGSGNFTEVIATSEAKEIFAVESSQRAIEKLQSKGVPKVTPLVFDLYLKQSWEKMGQMCSTARTLVIDPPREGLKGVRWLFQHFQQLKRIYYISCSVDSFVKDAKEICDHGWKILEIQPLDQFPNTPHIEILSAFQKN